jgi:hypothetical protein
LVFVARGVQSGIRRLIKKIAVKNDACRGDARLQPRFIAISRKTIPVRPDAATFDRQFALIVKLFAAGALPSQSPAAASPDRTV